MTVFLLREYPKKRRGGGGHALGLSGPDLAQLVLTAKACYRSVGTTGDPVPVGQRDVPVNHFTG